MLFDQITVSVILFGLLVFIIIYLILFVIFEVIKYIVLDEISKLIKARVIEGLYMLVTDYDLQNKVNDKAVTTVADLIVKKHQKNSFDYATVTQPLNDKEDKL